MAKHTRSQQSGNDRISRQQRSAESSGIIKGAQGWRAINNPSGVAAPPQSTKKTKATRPRAGSVAAKAAPAKTPGGKKKPPTKASAPPTRDTAAINWFLGLPRHVKQGLFATLALLCDGLMTVGLMIQNQPGNPLATLGSDIYGLFGWSAYLLAVGLGALAVAHLTEAFRRQEVIRLGLVVEYILFGCLLTAESRLIFGGTTGALFADLLTQPLKGFPAALQHALVLGSLGIMLALLLHITPRQVFGALRWLVGGVGTVGKGLFAGMGWSAQRVGAWRQQRAATRAAYAALSADEEDEEPISILPFPEDDEDNDSLLLASQLTLEDEADTLHVGTVRQTASGAIRARSGGQMGAAGGKAGGLVGSIPGAAGNGQPTSLSGGMAPLPPLPPNPLRRGGASGAIPAVAASLPRYELPAITLLNPVAEQRQLRQDEVVEDLAQRVEHTLRSFRIDAEVRRSDISIGPTVIRLGIRPLEKIKKDYRGKIMRDDDGEPVIARTRVNRILVLQNDLALDLEAKSIRMEAPVPGRPYIGVEIPNKNSRLVTLREVVASKEYEESRRKSKLTIALGRDVAGRPRIGDLARFPHLLIAGATGAGKSVCINSIIAAILMQATPEDVRFLMIDPKMVELINFNGIPHLLAPVVTETEKVVGTLKRGIAEMERRYRLFSKLGVRNLDAYRVMCTQRPELERLPNIVIIIDELADLMMSAPEEVEYLICRLAQLARATGIHLVVATQRPSVDVVTGLIKANIPTRISFMVSSSIDSRTILDMGGAERLLGRGDMLYLPAEASKPERIQGTFLADDELDRIVGHWRLAPHLAPTAEQSWEPVEEAEERQPEDDLLEEAEQVVREAGKASISLLIRKLSVGYGRAGRLIDLLEAHGVIGPADPSGKAREVLPPRPARGLAINPAGASMAGRRSDTMLPGSSGARDTSELRVIRNVPLPSLDPFGPGSDPSRPGARNFGIPDARGEVEDEDEGMEGARW